jgi:hypothetical protein
MRVSTCDRRTAATRERTRRAAPEADQAAVGEFGHANDQAAHARRPPPFARHPLTPAQAGIGGGERAIRRRSLLSDPEHKPDAGVQLACRGERRRAAERRCGARENRRSRTSSLPGPRGPAVDRTARPAILESGESTPQPAPALRGDRRRLLLELLADQRCAPPAPGRLGRAEASITGPPIAADGLAGPERT